MEATPILNSKVTTFVECVFDLVLNSINEGATAIAIRTNEEERKIQVVDNGTGWRESWLKEIGHLSFHNTRSSRRNEFSGCRKETLIKIRSLSDTMMITSRHRRSKKTYIKVFKMSEEPEIAEVESRPTPGTTVTVYGFYDLSHKKWNLPLMRYLIQCLAFNNSHISFTVRDDRDGKLIFGIPKPRQPIDILQSLCKDKIAVCNIQSTKTRWKWDPKFHGCVGLSRVPSETTQYIFYNNIPLHCPMLLEIISTIYKDVMHTRGFTRRRNIKIQDMFILFFITCSHDMLTTENQGTTLLLPRVHSFCQNIRRCMEKSITDTIFENRTNDENSNARRKSRMPML